MVPAVMVHIWLWLTSPVRWSIRIPRRWTISKGRRCVKSSSSVIHGQTSLHIIRFWALIGKTLAHSENRLIRFRANVHTKQCNYSIQNSRITRISRIRLQQFYTCDGFCLVRGVSSSRVQRPRSPRRRVAEHTESTQHETGREDDNIIVCPRSFVSFPTILDSPDTVE